MLVLVVTKKVREGLRMFSVDEFLLGCAMAGAKAHLPIASSFGTTEVVPCYKTRPSVPGQFRRVQSYRFATTFPNRF